jgi:hypothetical protein
MSDIEQVSYTEIMPRVGVLADELLNHPDEEVREQIEELLDWVDVFHREGLQRVLDLTRAWRGDLFLEEVAKDDVVGPFLSAYDFAEEDAQEVASEVNGAGAQADGDFS